MKRAILVLGILMATSRAWAQTCSPKTFLAAPAYPSGQYPWAIATGDFTNDSHPDILVASQADELRVLPGLGDGTFGAPITTSEDVYSAYLAVPGFFDGGSNLDVAAGYYGEIAVSLGNGDGTFQPPTFLATGTEPLGLVTADFDGDGTADLAESGGGLIRIFLGNGDGSFAEQTSVVAPGFVGTLAAGDVVGDSSVDLVAVTGDGVSIWPGLGNGAFGPPTALPLGGGVTWVALGDLDGNGFVDIAAGAANFAAVFHNLGNGKFLAAVEYPLSFQVSRLSVADVNGDGLSDLVALYSQQYNNTPGVVSVLIQQPDGTLGAASSFSAGGFGTVQMTTADFDGNGSDDVATTNTNDFTVSVLLATGDGDLSAVRITPLPPLGGNGTGLAAGDFDGDGLTDFMGLDTNNGGHVTFLRSDGYGHLEQGTVTPLALSNPTAVLAAELNGDGKLDLAVTDFFGQVAVLLGLGNGAFEAPAYYSTGFGSNLAVEGDFNGDGTPDLAILDNQGSNGDVNVLLGLGGGTFENNGSFALAHYPGNLVAMDLNGDSKSDLVLPNGNCCNGAQTVSVYLSNGDGTFQPQVEYPTASFPAWAAAADFNEDGHPDLVTANSNATNLTLLLGNGTGGFQPPTLVAMSAIATSVATGDFGPDGHADVVAVSGNPSLTSLLRGVGNGQFHLPENYVGGAGPFRPFPGHFDFGPAPDLAVLNSDQTVSILLNARLAAQVESVSTIVGSAAVLQAEASGFGPLSYQWRKDGIPLSDGGSISGALTATLTIDPVAFTDAGSYDVVVTDSCTDVTSSPATLSVEFDDVPLSNPFHNDIITIATAGITGGCTNTSYCPSHNVSRAEMAVLLLKAKYGADHVPPPPPPVPIFPDVPADAFAAAWIDELATLGITAGCGDGNGNFCPDAPVTRGQMAVFLLKTLIDSGYVPPPPVGLFSDVSPDYFAIAWIEDLYNRGITAGCASNPLQFCPDANVPREQMATFIVRTFLGP